MPDLPSESVEQDRADQLAAAKAATARLWRPLEEPGFHDVTDHAANLASIARQYRDAADLTVS